MLGAVDALIIAGDLTNNLPSNWPDTLARPKSGSGALTNDLLPLIVIVMTGGRNDVGTTAKRIGLDRTPPD